MSDGTPTQRAAEAIEAALSGILPGASCDGDWLATDSSTRVSINGMAVAAAEAAIDALQLTEEWGVQDRYGVGRTAIPAPDTAASIAARINARYQEDNKYVAGAAMAAPNAVPVSRLVGPWIEEEQ